jgi:hypothetical protein
VGQLLESWDIKKDWTHEAKLLLEVEKERRLPALRGYLGQFFAGYIAHILLLL